MFEAFYLHGNFSADIFINGLLCCVLMELSTHYAASKELPQSSLSPRLACFFLVAVQWYCNILISYLFMPLAAGTIVLVHGHIFSLVLKLSAFSNDHQLHQHVCGKHKGICHEVTTS